MILLDQARLDSKGLHYGLILLEGPQLVGWVCRRHPALASVTQTWVLHGPPNNTPNPKSLQGCALNMIPCGKLLGGLHTAVMSTACKECSLHARVVSRQSFWFPCGVVEGRFCMLC